MLTHGRENGYLLYKLAQSVWLVMDCIAWVRMLVCKSLPVALAGPCRLYRNGTRIVCCGLSQWSKRGRIYRSQSCIAITTKPYVGGSKSHGLAWMAEIRSLPPAHHGTIKNQQPAPISQF